MLGAVANDELRDARAGAGLSRPELAERVAARVHARTGRTVAIDGQYVAKVERGAIRWPGRDYREAFRYVLDAPTDAALGLSPEPKDVPRDVLDAAPDDDTSQRLSAVLDRPWRVDSAVVGHLAAMLAEQRLLEDRIGPRAVLPSTVAQLELIDHLARAARDSVRGDVLAIGSQYRQFAAWQSEDAGRYREALFQYDRAMEAAQEIGDDNMSTSVLSLKSHLAWSQRDAASAIGLACAGQRHPDRVSPGVLALVVQQEARGHALDGDASDLDRLLDRSAELTDQAAADRDAEPPWVYFQAPERSLYQRGIAYLELGRHGEAVELIEAARARLPESYRRDHGRYASTLAVAAARLGDVDRAVDAAHSALAIASEISSGRILADVADARRDLPDTAAVVELDELIEDGATPAGG